MSHLSYLEGLSAILSLLLLIFTGNKHFWSVAMNVLSKCRGICFVVRLKVTVSLILVLAIYYGQRIKANEVGTAFGTYGERKIITKILWRT
jgi:hypothetical protein